MLNSNGIVAWRTADVCITACKRAVGNRLLAMARCVPLTLAKCDTMLGYRCVSIAYWPNAQLGWGDCAASESTASKLERREPNPSANHAIATRRASKATGPRAARRTRSQTDPNEWSLKDEAHGTRPTGATNLVELRAIYLDTYELVLYIITTSS